MIRIRPLLSLQRSTYRYLSVRNSTDHKHLVESCPTPQYDTGCTHCEIPEFPPDKQIDYKKNLNGTSVLPWKHVLILSHGYSDFYTMPSKIEFVPGSLAQEINALKRGAISPYHPVLVSNVSSKFTERINERNESHDKGEQTVYLYPDNKIIKFDISNTKQFIKKYCVPLDEEMNKFEPVYNPFSKSTTKLKTNKQHNVSSLMFEEMPIENDLVLICGHMQRDIRCGELAPLLINEFERVLKKEGLDGKVDVGLISHIGGHAYAGNVIYFPADKSKSIVWYGRVFPSLVQGVVQETILRGNIIKELYRGEL